MILNTNFIKIIKMIDIRCKEDAEIVMQQLFGVNIDNSVLFKVPVSDTTQDKNFIHLADTVTLFSSPLFNLEREERTLAENLAIPQF